ncbi:MAG: YggT family protein [Spirochaetia bacterium]
MIISIVSKVTSALLSAYLILIMLRVLLSWFHTPKPGKAYRILVNITEPYLSFFRGFKIFKAKQFDFSPIIAVTVLAILVNIFVTLSAYGSISAGLVLAIIVSNLWSGIAFILLFFMIIIAVRFVSIMINVNSVSPIWRTLDYLLQNIVYRISFFFTRNRPIKYPHALLLVFGLLFFIRLLGGFLITQAVRYLTMIPF